MSHIHAGVPGREESLILALGLGNAGRMTTDLLNLISNTSRLNKMQANYQAAGSYCPSTGAGVVCSNIASRGNTATYYYIILYCHTLTVIDV